VIFAETVAGQRWKWRAVIFVCAAVATLPLAIKGASCGQDFDFHLQSWLAVSQQWHHGVLYPHWIEGANYGAGEPRLVFYPPFSWMLGALLGLIVAWNFAPVAFTLIVLTAGGLSMNKLASRWLPPNAAAAAACAYILNPYCLFVAYERTAYGELAAGIWLPLIILYTLRSTQHPHNPVTLCAAKDLQFPPTSTNLGAPHLAFEMWGFRNSTMPLALAIAAIWLTNAPAAVMASYTIAAITLWIAIHRRQWKPILPVAASYLLGIGLAAFYLIPAAYERRWVEIARAIDPGMRFSDSFLFEHTGQTYHDQVLRTASWIFLSLLIAITIAGVISWRRPHLRRKSLLPLFATSALLLALQIPPSTFLWSHAPELQFLQFPWRWSLVLSIVLAISIGLVIRITTGNQLKKTFALQITLTLAAALTLATIAAHYFWQYCDEEDAISAQLTLFHSGSGFEGTDEYTALNADNSLMQQRLPQIRILKQPQAETPENSDQPNPDYAADPAAALSSRIAIQAWQPESKSLTVTTQSPAYVILRLMDYPAWQVRANGNPINNRPSREDGLMTLPLQSGENHIDIAYAATPDVLVGRTVSVLSLVCLLALAISTRKRRTVV